MDAESQRAIAKFIETEMLDFKRARVATAESKRPLVTIARDHGSGGEEIGRGLAEVLGVNYFDKEIIERIAKVAGADPKMTAMLDETVRDQLQIWLSSFMGGRTLSPSEYQKGLVKVVLAIAPLGGVLIGRGANLILRKHSVFRVRIIGSPEVCARRLAAAQGMSDHDALAQVQKINQERARFVWESFKVRTNEPINYDIVVNTDHFPDLNKVVRFLAMAYDAHDDTAAATPRQPAAAGSSATG